ncbi:MAG: LCP family protein [Candidatus Fimenecus sp.]
MKRERANSEEKEILLEKKLDAKVDKKYQKELKKAEKRQNSKFRNSKFGKQWLGLAKWKRVTVYVIIAVLLVLLIAFLTVYGIYNNFRSGVDEKDLGISSEISDKYGETDIVNIALFGVDTRDENSFSGRSDTIMIVSIDRKNNVVKLSSILRDSYVAIEGHKNQKITHAYAFGGAQLAIKTINQNFSMNITDYATVNFYKMAEAIDLLGGIDIEVTEAERVHLNDIGDDENPNFGYLNESGMVHLTGEQAVVYARLRKIDSDVERSNRQKKVIEALLVQARKVSPSKYSEMLKTMMSLCETSLSFSEIMSFAPMLKEDITIEMTNVPNDEDNAIGGIYDGAWVWRYDLAAATERLHLFIYGEVPDEPVTKKNSSWGSNSSKTDSTKKTTTEPTEKSDQQPDNTAPTVSETTDTTALPDTSASDTTASETTEPVATQPPETTEPVATAPPETTAGDAAA